jgi:DNA gyrase subunit A
MVALVDGQPKLLNLKDMLECFIRHRREVVTRRTVFLLRKARERGHLLEGLAIAIANIDPVIELIRSSATTAEAREKLLSHAWNPGTVLPMLERAGENACRPDDLPLEMGLRNGLYYLSDAQVQAILDLRLQKLTGLEHDKLLEEYQEKLLEITEYLFILANPEKLKEVIREELEKVMAEYGDARRSEIVASQLDLSIEDLITPEDRVVTISRGGYAKSQPLADYQAQRRGGMGKSATAVKDEDFIEHLMTANTHDALLFFTSIGKVYWLKVYQIPVAGRSARGRPMINLLSLDPNERVTAILPVKEYLADHYIVMATANGTVKKTSLTEFSRPRNSGLRAIELDEGDTLIGTAITDGKNDIMLFASNGKAVRFEEDDVRSMGRTARGVRGIRLTNDARMIGLIIPSANGKILTVSENGYGKRTLAEEFPTKGRGTQGVIGMQCSDRNGGLVTAIQVFDGDQVMLISDQGTLVRTRTEEISLVSRNTQGVRVIRLKDGERLVGAERVAETEDDEILGDATDVVDGADAADNVAGDEAPAAE